MIGIIYRITCLITNEKYIGKHKCDTTAFDGYLGSGKIISAAIKKYGKENFIRQIIRIVNDDEDINELEKYYIRINNAVNRDDFYNLSDGGDGGALCIGENHPAKRLEVKKKMSDNHCNVSGINNPMYGKKRQDLSERNKMKLYKKHSIKIHCIEYPDIIFNGYDDAVNESVKYGWIKINKSNLSSHINDPIKHKSCGKDNNGNKLHWEKLQRR